MAVRVKLKIIVKNKVTEVVALANAGYETDENEMLIPDKLAKMLKLKREKKVRYHTAGGDVDMSVLGKATVNLITEDRKSKSVITKLVSSPYGEEVIINDKLVGNLGIVLLKVDKGLWKFLDDPPDKERPSEQKQTY